jgi:hypothetical protein
VPSAGYSFVSPKGLMENRIVELKHFHGFLDRTHNCAQRRPSHQGYWRSRKRPMVAALEVSRGGHRCLQLHNKGKVALSSDRWHKYRSRSRAGLLRFWFRYPNIMYAVSCRLFFQQKEQVCGACSLPMKRRCRHFQRISSVSSSARNSSVMVISFLNRSAHGRPPPSGWQIA